MTAVDLTSSQKDSSSCTIKHSKSDSNKRRKESKPNESLSQPKLKQNKKIMTATDLRYSPKEPSFSTIKDSKSDFNKKRSKENNQDETLSPIQSQFSIKQQRIYITDMKSKEQVLKLTRIGVSVLTVIAMILIVIIVVVIPNHTKNNANYDNHNNTSSSSLTNQQQQQQSNNQNQSSSTDTKTNFPSIAPPLQPSLTPSKIIIKINSTISSKSTSIPTPSPSFTGTTRETTLPTATTTSTTTQQPTFSLSNIVLVPPVNDIAMADQPYNNNNQNSSPTTPAPSSASSSSLSSSRTTIFYGIGDVPYKPEQAIKLREQMISLPNDAEFLIHVGDIRKENDKTQEKKECQHQEYKDVAEILRLSHTPVFIILGDNEWNDCPNPDDGLNFWTWEFFDFASRFWNHTFQIQKNESYPHSFAFVHKSTLYIGLKVVGTPVINQTDWSNQLTGQAEWTKSLIRSYEANITAEALYQPQVVLFGHAYPVSKHDDFFVPLQEFIENELQNRIPILYLHGDRHKWDVESEYRNQTSWLRIMVSGLAVDPPLKVTVPSVSVSSKPRTLSETFIYDRYAM